MAIAFDPTEKSQLARDHYHRIALEQMRPVSRKYDDREHDLPVEWVEWFWEHGRQGFGRREGPGDGFVQVCIQAEELCWETRGSTCACPRRPWAARR